MTTTTPTQNFQNVVKTVKEIPQLLIFPPVLHYILSELGFDISLSEVADYMKQFSLLEQEEGEQENV